MERDSWLSILEFITCTFFSTYSGMAAVGVNYSLLHPRWRSVVGLFVAASAVAERMGFCIRGGGVRMDTPLEDTSLTATKYHHHA